MTFCRTIPPVGGITVGERRHWKGCIYDTDKIIEVINAGKKHSDFNYFLSDTVYGKYPVDGFRAIVNYQFKQYFAIYRWRHKSKIS